MKMFYIYKITNTINNRYYIGVHHTANPMDSYYGSGPAIKSAVEKYGKENFIKEILYETADREDAYAKERELVVTLYEDSLSYNMKPGGIGGWDYYNNDPNRKNCMHDKEVANRVSEVLKEKYKNDEKYRKQLIENSKKATLASAEVTRGKKRPEHSIRQKQYCAEGRYDHFFAKRTPSIFKVINPHGEEIVVYNLLEFCYNNDLTYTSLWLTHKSPDSIVKRGKSKGWRCELIEKGKYEKRNTKH